MSKKFMLLLRVLLVGLCLVYALKNIDPQTFKEIVSHYEPWKIAALAGSSYYPAFINEVEIRFSAKVRQAAPKCEAFMRVGPVELLPGGSLGP